MGETVTVRLFPQVIEALLYALFQQQTDRVIKIQCPGDIFQAVKISLTFCAAHAAAADAYPGLENTFIG